MPLLPLNSVGGYSTGITGTAVIDANGNITGVGATFSGLAIFNAGISAAGGTFGGNIRLQNAEFLQNTTNGRIDFMPAPAGSTHYGLYVDMTSWGFGPRLGTVRSSDGALNTANILWDAPLSIGTNTRFNLTSDSSHAFLVTTTGNDTLQVGIRINSTSYAGAMALVDDTALGAANRSPGVTHSNPNLYIYRAGSASANDFIRIEHNGTNGIIVSGGTTGISLEPGSGVVGISGGITGITQITFSSGQTASAIVTESGGATGNVELPRIEWCGLTSGFDIIPSNWANMSAPISTSPTANDAYFAPISISRRCRIKTIGTQNGASSSGNTGNVYFGVYTSNLYGYPDQRLYISASTALTTGNFGVLRVSNVDTIVNPGLYWLAIVYSASSIPTSGLGRLGARMKWMTPLTSSPIAQVSVDGLRAAQGSFTLLTGQTGPFTNVEGPANPCIFYTSEGI